MGYTALHPRRYNFSKIKSDGYITDNDDHHHHNHIQQDGVAVTL
jgi:hypothetical protein